MSPTEAGRRRRQQRDDEAKAEAAVDAALAAVLAPLATAPAALREAAAKQQRCVLTFREALLLVAGQKPELQVRVLEALTELEEARAALATVGDAVESCLVSARVGDEKQAEADAASQSEGDSGVSM